MADLSTAADNTMILYPDANRFGAKCGSGSKYNGKISSEQKRAILSKHNKLRQKFRTGALEWDDGLAEIAQRWANQCPGARGNPPHDENRATKRFPDGAGQNVYTRWSYKPTNKISVKDFTNAVQTWYDEVKYFKKYGCPRKFNGNCAKGKRIDHFTQVIWAATTRVGCGWIKYRSRGMYTTSVVCNYGARGNMLGAPIY